MIVSVTELLMLVIVVNSSDCGKIQDDIYNLGNWVKSWDVILHPSKCNDISFAKKMNPVYIFLNGVKLLTFDS